METVENTGIDQSAKSHNDEQIIVMLSEQKASIRKTKNKDENIIEKGQIPRNYDGLTNNCFWTKEHQTDVQIMYMNKTLTDTIKKSSSQTDNVTATDESDVDITANIKTQHANNANEKYNSICRLDKDNRQENIFMTFNAPNSEDQELLAYMQ